MKRAIKLFSAVVGVILFASACASRTCPTYADHAPVEPNQEITRSV